ncbi:hypothetical protein [Salaquimonas pukyongi]|uniref:hypothetical protein n=1 Tax=Salaquimonas pukyongi TaxID=2712698 RepID=UPI00096B9284|nr:hypothetical protein [Salaquimonas pukyongi]
MESFERREPGSGDYRKQKGFNMVLHHLWCLLRAGFVEILAGWINKPAVVFSLPEAKNPSIQTASS